MEFLPAAYFGKTYLIDGRPELFPRHPDAPMEKELDGSVEPQALASGKQIVLSPADPLTRVTITAEDAALMLFDRRNKAQNGWFVVRRP